MLNRDGLLEITGQQNNLFYYSPMYLQKSNLLRIRFWYDVVDDDINHRTRRERQGVRQGWLGQTDGQGTKNSEYWFHHTTKLSIPETCKNLG